MDDLRLLREMLEIYSPSYDETLLSNYCTEQMTRLGFDAWQDDVGNTLGIVGPGARSACRDVRLVMLGHIDTVRGFIDVDERDGLIHGRGSVDAKGPFAAFICAANAVKDELQYSIAVIGVVEEEVASSAGAYYCRDRFNPELCIIGEPSGWNGITLGYKGSFHLQYVLREEKLHYSGRRYTASMTGIKFWNRLQQFCEDYNRGKKLFDSLLPTLVTINSSDDDYHLEVILDIGLRTPPEFDRPAFESWVSESAGAATVHYTGNFPAVKMPKSNRLIRAFLKSIRAVGGTPRFKYKTGTSDMNILAPAWQCPFVAYGPGDSTLDHAPNEHAGIAEYGKGIEVLKGVLLKLNDNV